MSGINAGTSTDEKLVPNLSFIGGEEAAASEGGEAEAAETAAAAEGAAPAAAEECQEAADEGSG